MPTIRALLTQGTARLSEAGSASASLDSRLLLQHALGYSPEQISKEQSQLVKKQLARDFEQLITQRSEGKSVATIIGKKPFWEDEFYTTTDTLDPRPDSETLIAEALKLTPPPNTILDLGTGTGCLLLTLLKSWPESNGIGVDISTHAIKVAKKNARELGVSNRVHFTKSSWWNEVDGTFDLILSNPPYIASTDIRTLPRDVVASDPALALDGGADGLDAYKAILAGVAEHSHARTRLLFEIGQGQAESVSELCEEHFSDVAIAKDLAGIARVVICHSPV